MASFDYDLETRVGPVFPRARPGSPVATLSDMLTTSRLTPAQRRIRESRPKRPPDPDRIAHYRIQLPRVRESVIRVPERARDLAP